ncbi:MAG: hypothetical protein J0I20_33935 [Chloroflexi bacterium]|nr:hypothetical protein [Chloroflexota bacterium]OJW05605.1 MAG: hypothetical protein BGO39_03030 [Chloroflexi bacterium 54-19]
MKKKIAKIYSKDWVFQISNEVNMNEYLSDEVFEELRKDLQEKADKGELPVKVEDVTEKYPNMFVRIG